MSSPVRKGGQNTGVDLAVPPPTLHARTGSDLGDRPLTPLAASTMHNAFTSPSQTPQGSPSKNRMPPGAFDLPDVFSNAMKLLPTLGSSSKSPPRQQAPLSPNKSNLQREAQYDDPFADPAVKASLPGSPTRKSNKENTPPPSRLPVQQQTQQQHQQKDAAFANSNFTSHAAASRQDAYRTQGDHSPTRQRSVISGGLTPEEIEKLAKPSVKRMANVTQLCECKHPTRA